MSNYPVPGNANESNLLIQTAFCIFKIAIMAIVMTDLFVTISGIYDVTIGFPGEGHRNNPDWSQKFANLSVATWNTRTLTPERFEYCQSLGYDILAVTELWRQAHSCLTGTTSFIPSVAQKDEKGDLIFPNDPASGVGILLSERAQQKYLKHGSPCERIAWVRLKGPATNLFVIAAYIPHRARVDPCQKDTLDSLQNLLKQVPKNDCIILLGDFNEQLPKSVPDLTGKWAYGEASPNAESLLSIMSMFNLYAANTGFQPKKRNLSASCTACTEYTFTPSNTTHPGRPVQVRCRGELIKDKIM